jgi:tetratricopeptide (TPR) repeat protein
VDTRDDPEPRPAGAGNEIDHWSAILEEQPSNVEALVARARKRIARGDVEAGLQDADRAIALEPSSALAHYARGNGLARSGRSDGAIDEFGLAIALDPTLASAFYNRWTVHAELGHLAASIADYDHAIELEPDHALAYNNRGHARAQLGRFQLAIPDYDRALELDATNPIAYLNRGYARIRLSQPDLATADYDRALELDPTSAVAYNDRGYARSRLGQNALAVPDYDRALELGSTDIRVLQNRAASLVRLGRHAEAIADYERILDLQPNSAHAYSNRSLARMADGDLAGAHADASRAVDLARDPHSSIAARRARAAVSRRRRRYDLASLDEIRAWMTGLRLDARTLVQRIRARASVRTAMASFATRIREVPARVETARRIRAVMRELSTEPSPAGYRLLFDLLATSGLWVMVANPKAPDVRAMYARGMTSTPMYSHTRRGESWLQAGTSRTRLGRHADGFVLPARRAFRVLAHDVVTDGLDALVIDEGAMPTVRIHRTLLQGYLDGIPGEPVGPPIEIDAWPLAQESVDAIAATIASEPEIVGAYLTVEPMEGDLAVRALLLAPGLEGRRAVAERLGPRIYNQLNPPRTVVVAFVRSGDMRLADSSRARRLILE